MRCIGMETLRDKPVLVTETNRLLCKPKIRKFYASKQLVGRYWRWLELPDKKIVPDELSFQLDAWLEELD